MSYCMMIRILKNTKIQKTPHFCGVNLPAFGSVPKELS